MSSLSLPSVKIASVYHTMSHGFMVLNLIMMDGHAVVSHCRYLPESSLYPTSVDVHTLTHTELHTHMHTPQKCPKSFLYSTWFTLVLDIGDKGSLNDGAVHGRAMACGSSGLRRSTGLFS